MTPRRLTLGAEKGREVAKGTEETGKVLGKEKLFSFKESNAVQISRDPVQVENTEVDAL